MLSRILRQFWGAAIGRKKRYHNVSVGTSSTDDQHSAEHTLTEVQQQDCESLVAHARAALVAGHHASAIDYASRALECGSSSPIAYYHLGKIYLEAGYFDDAEYCLRMVLSRNRANTRAYLQLGACLFRMRRPKEAVEAYQTALDQDAGLVEAHEGIADALIDQGNFSASLSHLEKTLPSFEDPSYLDAYFKLAKVAHKAGDFVPAKKYCSTVLSQRPNWVSARACLALIQRGEGNLPAASATIDQALAEDPDFLLGRWVRGILRLSQYKFDVAWEDYEVGVALGERKFRYLGRRTWNGETLAGKTVLVYGEQGLGDEILFASCLEEVVEVADKTIIECNPKLRSLFQASFPTAITCVADLDSNRNWMDRLPKWDVETPIGSLPMFLRRSRGSFRRRRYLRTDQTRVEHWKSRLAMLGVGLKVGISWRGGTAWTGSKERSIDLPLWEPILTMPGIHLINLQYGDYRDEIVFAAEKFGRTILTWDDALRDYNETASLVDALDLVISVQTAVVHLAGALGKQVFALIPVGPEWRYGSEGSNMIWYPNVRLFRQEKQYDWSQVIHYVAAELSTLALSRCDSLFSVQNRFPKNEGSP